MAMIDFEDRMPAAPMGMGEKLFLASVVLMQAWGLYATAVGGWDMVKGLFQ